ncbi:hypothetical protein BJ085DRAFT_31857 [Dimargaris cristalligena]|uniref:Uncharacterized protein n=1 Tax=Dimargaris cristalligena TaxID=215637 RepID=A0A4P9ZWH8_9FUNG|nr:hypothetical protein BJ085DRAFT_31857 [Dimargaris cristalligena]|eukprot:RKP37963.1 hypothetical protein BJ085DRAFT_31857 [Dimargaris cristalligena]
MKVTSVYAKVLFVATASLLIATRVRAAPALAKSELPLPVTQRSAMATPKAPSLLTRRYRSFSARSARHWGTRPNAQQRTKNIEIIPNLIVFHDSRSHFISVVYDLNY